MVSTKGDYTAIVILLRDAESSPRPFDIIADRRFLHALLCGKIA